MPRSCAHCYSSDTTVQKATGRPIWRLHEGKHWCHRCYTRKVYRPKHANRDNQSRRAAYESHRELILERNRLWKRAHPNYRKAYYLIHKVAENQGSKLHRTAHPDYHKSRLAEYRRENPRRIAAYRALRRKALDLATPGWVNWAELLQFYINRPPGHSVDHIIPIKNSKVCGLHVPCNLQYLPYHLNSLKHNKFDGTYENSSWYILVPE